MLVDIIFDLHIYGKIMYMLTCVYTSIHVCVYVFVSLIVLIQVHSYNLFPI